MPDKEIIDGEHDMNYCEDSNCKHYGKKEQCEKTHCYYRCYSKLYKQLKRKEQECKLLKSALKNQNIVAIVEENDQLKAENEKLKSVSMQKCPQCGEVYLNPVGVEILEENEALKIGNEKLKEKLKAYIEDRFCQGGCAIYQYDKIHRLKQALDEIKENVGEIEENFGKLTHRIPSFQMNSMIEDIVTIQDIINKARGGKQ